ncbi:hypothetical protein PAXRUDRAFT_835594 [Paxillus rubicundulus Ve08.2h10]|uniref:Uncharacterized protein n=1 Tax=Paxillus rubicundulus Ve08.2h10 TaxID=930991 RepID=A0A0D0DDW8_9AGAM|nr:hypothetical protein PAXRUDRAFT_835594 [Paxillus rubicundulus Ve08.2h10]
MKTFLTFLAATTALSAYTLVGVHAASTCAICPVKVASRKLERQCTTDVTTCTYHGKKDIHCYYDPTSGYLNHQKGSSGRCPKGVHTSTTCVCG